MDEARYREAERALWTSVGASPTEHRLPLERLATTVRVLEAGDGPPVLFVHGASNGATSWAPLVTRLPEFRCLMLDRPGCGLSDPVRAPFHDLAELGAFADTLIVDVLDALELDRAHVVATSFGGYVTLRSAAAHPDRIARVVELGYPVGATRLPFAFRLASQPGMDRVMTAVPPSPRSVRALLRRIGLRHAVDSGRFTPVMLDWYLSLLRDTNTLGNELGMGPRFPLPTMDDRAMLPMGLLASIDTPVRLLWGDDDPFGDARVARRFVSYLPNAELALWPGAGHAPWIDDPERAATATREFLLAGRG